MRLACANATVAQTALMALAWARSDHFRCSGEVAAWAMGGGDGGFGVGSMFHTLASPMRGGFSTAGQ